MTRIFAPFLICFLAAAGVASASVADASPFGSDRPIAGAGAPEEQPYVVAAADCSGAAAEAAAQTGGQVLSVSSRNEGGRAVCVVVVLVPGNDGERPRKTTITIRQ